jgi:hypothetical protein
MHDLLSEAWPATDLGQSSGLAAQLSAGPATRRRDTMLAREQPSGLELGDRAMPSMAEEAS